MPKSSPIYSPNHILIIALLLVTCLTGTGCTSKQEKNIPGIVQHEMTSNNFEETWWNYYKRALILSKASLLR